MSFDVRMRHHRVFGFSDEISMFDLQRILSSFSSGIRSSRHPFRSSSIAVQLYYSFFFYSYFQNNKSVDFPLGKPIFCVENSRRSWKKEKVYIRIPSLLLARKEGGERVNFIPSSKSNFFEARK